MTVIGLRPTDREQNPKMVSSANRPIRFPGVRGLSCHLALGLVFILAVSAPSVAQTRDFCSCEWTYPSEQQKKLCAVNSCVGLAVSDVLARMGAPSKRETWAGGFTCYSYKYFPLNVTDVGCVKEVLIKNDVVQTEQRISYGMSINTGRTSSRTVVEESFNDPERLIGKSTEAIQALLGAPNEIDTAPGGFTRYFYLFPRNSDLGEGGQLFLRNDKVQTARALWHGSGFARNSGAPISKAGENEFASAAQGLNVSHSANETGK